MDINGKIVQLLAPQSGEGKNGTWQKQEYILETQGQYPKKVCFQLWGDKINQFGIKEGDQVQVSFDLDSREFNGRWYTDVKAWNVKKEGEGSTSQPNAAPAQQLESVPFDDADDFSGDNSGDGDLPF